jgi:hypothetical protein
MTTQFKVPVNGSEIDLYIGEPKDGSHPLSFQEKALAEARNIQIPGNIMSSMQETMELAKENDIPFEHLWQYVLDSAFNKENDKGNI